MKKKAEIAAYCLDFDGAEKMYIDMDRKDLALDLRIRLGDWFRVVQLIKTGASGDDALLEKAYNKIGDYYAERQRWRQAVNYYGQARNYEKLVKESEERERAIPLSLDLELKVFHPGLSRTVVLDAK